MGKPVRVNEDNYLSLVQMAQADGRTPTNMLNRILDERFGRSTIGEVQQTTPFPKITEPETPRMGNTTLGSEKIDVDAFIKNNSEPSGSGALEQECCQHPTRPCKHWQWDTVSGEGYKNILSGRFREAD